MSNIAELLNELVEKKAQIERIKVEHPEMAEAIQLVEEYTTLFMQLCQQSTPNFIPYPVIYPYNPIYPSYPWVNYTKQITITWDANTVIQPENLLSTCAPRTF